MKVLLLGSKGLVGTAIEKSLEYSDFEYTALSHDSLDITDSDALKDRVALEQPDFIINAVGIVGVNPCEEDPTRAFAVNVSPVIDLSVLCDRYDIALVQLSTHSVFDGTKDDYYTEPDIPRPVNVYGLSKLTSELVTMMCRKPYVVRMPTLFGDRRKGRLGFPNKIFEMLDEGKDITVADDKLDSCSYSDDVADRIIELLELPYGIYHIANAGKATYYEVIEEAKRLMGSSSVLTRGKDGDFMHHPNALRTAMKSAKLPPLRPWQDALKEYLDGS